MSYCPKCGEKVNEGMSFCPKCGAPVKGEQVAEAMPRGRRRDEKDEKREKEEKGEKDEKTEKYEKREYSFLGPLVGGLILIILGAAAYLEIAGMAQREVIWSLFLVLVGIVILIAAVFGLIMASRRHPRP